ncbi:MAG: flagellar basal body rod protein FlgB [Phycisphaerae bacterium]|nr:flagellar basal body rod protein FlgB [Phycisphaerae bacterium]
MGGTESIVSYLEAGLNTSSLRRRAIAHNIANLNTPGFRRNAVEFEKLLAEAMESPSGVDFEEIRGRLHKPMNTPVKGNGNDVNLEVEVGELIKSSGRHKTYLRLLNKLYKQMEMAMRDQF